MKRCLFAILILCAALLAAARPGHTISIMAGSAHTADSYLSPLRYSGASVGVTYDFKHFYMRPAMLTVSTQLRGSRTLNPAGNAIMWGADLMLSSHYLWKLPVSPELVRVYLGTGISASLGALYLPRNGNNPVSASARICADAALYCEKDIRLSNLPLTLSLTAAAPLTGAFFRQAYGELYYEIWMGNKSGLVHWAHPGNLLAPDIKAAATIPLGKIHITAAYVLNVDNSYAHSLTHRCIYHSFAAGIAF